LKKKDKRKCSIIHFLIKIVERQGNECYVEEQMKRENEFIHIFLLSFQKELIQFNHFYVIFYFNLKSTNNQNFSFI